MKRSNQQGIAQNTLAILEQTFYQISGIDIACKRKSSFSYLSQGCSRIEKK